MVTVHLSLALVGAGLAGCQTATAPRGSEIVVRGAGEGVSLTATAEGCRADGVAIRSTGGEAHGGGWHLTRAPGGLALALRDATLVRVIDDPGPPLRRAYLDPVGVPLARVTFDGDSAAVSGADRTPIGALAREEGALVWRDTAGATSRVEGTDDLELAVALLVPPSVPIAGRAVVACARLVTSSLSPVKS